MLALFGGGHPSFIPLAPLSLGKQAHIVNGWEAGRIPEPALERIPAAVSLIIYSSHYCPLDSHGDSIPSVQPSDQINTRKELSISFVPLQKHHMCGGDSGASGFISPTSRLSLTNKLHDLK